MDGDKIKATIDAAATRALVVGADALLIKIINAAPIKTGTLRRSHTVTSNPLAHSVTISANTPYAERLHEGGPAYTITPTNAKALYWSGATHPVKKVTHPATKGNPWMNRTIEENMDSLGDFITSEVIKALEGL